MSATGWTAENGWMGDLTQYPAQSGGDIHPMEGFPGEDVVGGLSRITNGISVFFD